MIRQQLALGNHQIVQHKQAEVLSVILGQSAVAGLAMTKKVLDHVERVLNLGADACLDLLQHLAQRDVAEVLALARLHAMCHWGSWTSSRLSKSRQPTSPNTLASSP